MTIKGVDGWITTLLCSSEEAVYIELVEDNEESELGVELEKDQVVELINRLVCLLAKMKS